MTLSIDDRPGDVSRWVTCSADLKRRITTLRVLIVDCDRMAADLDNEVHKEESRVKIYDLADVAYSIYAKASASSRDHLRRSANELRAHLAKAEKAAWTAVQQQINAEKERKGPDGCEENDNLPQSRRPLGAWDDPKTKAPATLESDSPSRSGRMLNGSQTKTPASSS